MTNLRLYTILMGCALLLTACPDPYPYAVVNIAGGSHFRIDRPEFSFEIVQSGPWWDSKKNVIDLVSHISNRSNDTLKFVRSKCFMYSRNDTFVTKNYEGSLVNNFRNEADTTFIAPGELLKLVGVYFFSQKNYTQKEFRRFYNNDTVYLHLNLFNLQDTTLSLVKP